MNITFLGTACMQPTKERNHPAILLSYKSENILMDCGEGTQISLKILKWGFKAIDVICITHFHADHISG